MPKQNQTHKFCPICKEFVPKEKFSKHYKRYDGLQSVCKCCMKQKSYDWLESREGAAKHKKWKEKNRDKMLEYHKNYGKKNRTTLSAKEKERKETDPIFKITKQMRAVVYSSLKRGLKENIKFESTVEMIGCTPKEFIEHLENLFQPGMSWDNREEWEIDHINPVALFDMANPSDQKACNHYTNLQPLWKKDHLEKTKKDLQLIRSRRSTRK